jgi:hypothetical protein
LNKFIDNYILEDLHQLLFWNILWTVPLSKRDGSFY